MMHFKFWKNTKPLNINKRALSQESRGRKKGALAVQFRAFGFTDKTPVLLIDNNADGKTAANPTMFGQVPAEAIYKGRGNRTSGKGRHGFFHVFDIS